MFEKEDLPYEIREGSPTVTFVTGEQQHMLPWHSFQMGTYQNGQIDLEFHEVQITIVGQGLDAVWQHVRTEDLAQLRMDSSKDGTCIIQNLEVKREMAS